MPSNFGSSGGGFDSSPVDQPVDTSGVVSGSGGLQIAGPAHFSNTLGVSGSFTAGGTIKQDNSTYGGMTRHTVGVATLTLPKPNNTSTYVDTTVNIPAYSIIRYIFIEKTTPGVNSNGTLHLANIAMRYGGTTPDGDYDEYYNDWDVPGGSDRENGYNLEGAAGANDYTGHHVINGVVDGKSGRAVFDYARDLWLKVKAVGDASGGTAPVVSLLVVYDTFDLS
jgi:hypothetical protein